MSDGRIVSLLPSVTETVVALGLGDRLVGRSHECDYPAWVADLPAVTSGRLPADAVSQREIDDAVRDAVQTGAALYGLDAPLLADLAPDLVVTQSLCAVCAVDEGLALAAVAAIDPPAHLLSLAPGRLEEVIASVREVADAAGEPARGLALAESLHARLTAVAASVGGRARPRAAAVEWLDPPFSAGHWVPDQVTAAGGHEVMVAPGARSVAMTWDDVAAARPDVVVLMPCGLELDAVVGLASQLALPEALTARIIAVDASAFFSRPGPRLVDGVEVLAAALHPGAVPPAPRGSWAEVRPARGR